MFKIGVEAFGSARAGHARPLQGGDGKMKDGRRAASPLAAVEVCGGGKVPGRDESLPYELTTKGIWRQVAGRACPAPTGGDGEDGKWRKTGRWCLHNFAAGLII